MIGDALLAGVLSAVAVLGLYGLLRFAMWRTQQNIRERMRRQAVLRAIQAMGERKANPAGSVRGIVV